MKVFQKYSFHPVLIGAYPVLALYAANIYQVDFEQVWRSLLIAVACAAALQALLRLLGASWMRAGLAASITAVLFFSYGHLLHLLLRAQVAGSVLGRPDILTLLWPVAWILLTWAALRLLKNVEPINLLLNVISSTLVALVLFQLTAAALPAWFRPLSAKLAPIEASFQRADAPPDIYYIILDGYARQDILQEALHYDNSAFIGKLEQKGFYVASRSTSNYSNTTPSIASSLNLDYINALAQQVGPKSQDYHPLQRLIQNSRLSPLLKENGYQTIAFETGFQFTELHGADRYITLQTGPNYFESLLLSNSVAMFWTLGPENERYRSRISGTLQHLADTSSLPSPKFIFVHVMAAHPPFVFGPNGEALASSARVELDGGEPGSRSAEIQGYTNQLTYINTLVINMIDSIVASSASEPVIILQGDHGSGIYMDWQSADNTCFAERKAILNAYYFPGGRTDLLYPTITPVNSFRAVLNTYLGADLPFLEDRNYFSLWESPYQLSDITGHDGNCPFRQP